MRETRPRTTFSVPALWAILRPMLGMAVSFGILMAILPALKIATGPQQDVKTWANQWAGSYGSLLALGLDAAFVVPPVIVAILAARRADDTRASWVAAAACGIVAGFAVGAMFAVQSVQTGMQSGQPLSTLIAYGAAVTLGTPVAVGVWSALLGFVTGRLVPARRPSSRRPPDGWR